MKAYKRFASTVAVLLTLSCTAASAQRAGTSTVVESLRWSPLIEFDNQIFPAVILGMSTRRIEKLPPNYLGDPNGSLGIEFVNPHPGARVKVSIKVDGLGEESTFEGATPDDQGRLEIFPSMRFDSRSLARVQESFPTTATFRVWTDGELLGEQTRTVQVRAVNDVPFNYRSRDGQTQDLSALFAAFVNENHPSINEILKQAIDAKAVQRFIGYQGSSDDVMRQVFAIWNVLQRRGVTYSSITRPSGDSEIVHSQHVRFLDESVRFAQANCVDGTVLFASILYKIDLAPVLVIKPGHMFLGVNLSRPTTGQRPNMIFLETTLIGNPGLKSFRKNWIFLTESGYRDSESYRQFIHAVNVGNQTFQSMANALAAHQPSFQVIDIAAARKSGIAAIPRF